jgi:pilus assembly protein CpaC
MRYPHPNRFYKILKRAVTISALVILFSMPAIAANNPTILSVTVDHGIPMTLGTPASSVFIANPDIADVQVMSPTSIMIFGKRTGETTFMATDANGVSLAHHTIIVRQDLAPLRSELNASIPGNKIGIESVPNGLVLTGEAKDSATVADAYKIAMRYIPAGGDIINRIRVSGSNQIMIRVRFAEVSRTIDNTLGIDWNSTTSIGGMLFGIASGAAFVPSATALVARPNNTSLTKPNDIIQFSRQGGHTNINGLIDALAQDGLVSILAEPNLTAMSGETASFLAGGEIPVPIPQASSTGGTTITIEWKQYGVSLQFTPTILTNDRISLHVKPEVSELTSIGSITTSNITIPGLTTRKAETTVEVASGQSFAIAGMLNNNQSQTVDKYPLLGDVPVLGALFRSNHFQRGETELIVIITPYIVKPSGEQLALPMDGYSPPSESERLVGLRYSSGDPNARPMGGAPVARMADPSTALPIPPVPSSALVPEKATVVPVMTESSPMSPLSKTMATKAPAVPTPAPVSAPVVVAPARENPTRLTPSGPGGFVLE